MRIIATGRRWLRSVSQYLALALVVGVPLVVIAGVAFPWQAAEPALAALHAKAHLLVAVDIRYRPSAGEPERTEARSYVLVPATLAWPALVTVSKSGPAAAVAATPSTPKFLSFAAAYLCAAIVVWRRWFRRRAGRAHRPGAAESFVGPA